MPVVINTNYAASVAANNLSASNAMLQRSLKMSLPEVLRGEPSLFFELAPPPEAGEVVMFLYINFAVRQRDIRGYIAMLMDMPSLEALKVLLAEFIERMAGGVTPSNDRD